MNYHDWAKNAPPEANCMSPEITCSTCIQCGKDFKRDANMQFNPLICYSCMGKNMMNAADTGLNNSLSRYFNIYG